MYAEIVFPLPFRNTFTYSIPNSLQSFAKTGVRAVAPFGKRVLTGFIINITIKADLKDLSGSRVGKIKPLSDILDDKPVFNDKILQFYRWLSDYYLSSLGEALKLAVPYGTEVESKRKIITDKNLCTRLLSKEKDRNSLKGKILKIISERDEINFSHLQRLVKKKNIYSALSLLEDIGAVTILDEVEGAKVKVKKEKFVKLVKSVADLYTHFPEIENRSPKQVKILLELISKKNGSVPLNYILKRAEAAKSSVDSLQKKGFVKIFEKEVNRDYVEQYKEIPFRFELTAKQQEIIEEVSASFHKFQPYLLHGVTGSGKTQVYIELIKKVLEQDKSALILVPEISLTPQITSRLYNNFGNQVAVLHSRMSLGERYDSWRKILKGKCKVLSEPGRLCLHL